MVKTRDVAWRDLSITESDIVRSLGYREAQAPAPVVDDIRDCLAAIPHATVIRGGYRVISSVTLEEERMVAGDAVFRIGATIARQLAASESAAVFACTAGSFFEQRSKQLMAQGEFVKGYALDAIASEAVERGMDRIQKELKEELSSQGIAMTRRYSPGYCGWPVSDQHQLFTLLPPGFCGISLTESALMMPIKSISGVVGIGRSVQFGAYQCGMCEMKNCFRRNKKRAERVS